MFLTIEARKPIRILLALGAFISVVLAGYLFLNIAYPLKYIDIINEQADKYGMSPAFVCAVIHTESKFRKEALSHKGASGLMQLTENTANWLAEEMDLKDYSYEKIFEPDINITLGTYYLNKLFKQYEGMNTNALAAYNAGSGNVAKWLRNPEYSQDGKTLAHVPFKETRDFITRINRSQKIYEYILNYFH